MKADVLFLIWNEQRRLILILTSIVMVNILFLVAVLNPSAYRNEEARFELLKAQENLRSKNADRQKVLSPHRKFQVLEQDIDKFYSLLPPEKEFTSFLKELYRIAGRSNLGIDSVTYSPKTVESTRILGYGLSFSLKGEYKQIRDFISATEKSEYLIMISRLGLRTENNDGGEIDFQVSMTVYFAKEESE